MKQIEQHANSNVAKVLVANKCDRPDKVIESERGRALAEQHGLQFFETSAKTGLNVADVFHQIARIIVNEKMPAPTETRMSSYGNSNTFSHAANSNNEGNSRAHASVRID